MTSSHLAPPSSSSTSKPSTSPSTSSPLQQSSSAHHNHHHSHHPPIPTAPLLDPPALFASVAPQIYRSATPTPHNHSFLRTLQLRTILSLTAELPSPSLTSFCRKHNIRFLHLGLKRWAPPPPPPSSSSSSDVPDISFLHTTSTSPSTLTEQLVKDSLQLVLNSSYHPVLVTDTSGIHEIGVLLGCLRKLQRWNFATILLEYRHFAGNRARATNERFIEMFDTDLVAYPEQAVLPYWFKEQIEEDDRELDHVNAA